MKLSSIEQTLITSMARTFFVCAWIDKQEQLREDGKKHQHPGPGGDWFDIAPAKTPKGFRDHALMVAGGLNGSPYMVIWNAAKADALEEYLETRPDDRDMTPVERWDLISQLEPEIKAMVYDEDYATELGHYIAMMSLGHGVSWFDDHAKFDLKVPYTEVWL